MEALLQRPEAILHERTDVSGWSVFEQVQHVLIANKWALSAVVAMLLGQGDYAESGRKNLLGTVLLALGWIPRGRAQAPATARPNPDVEIAELSSSLQKQRGYLERITDRRGELASLKKRFQHPVLGDFSAEDGIRFVRVHTRHHLTIVDDILKASSAS
jgi:hypothetical protein